VLEDIRKAFAQEPELTNLVASDVFSAQLNQLQDHIRAVLQVGIDNGIPMPATMAAMAYFDGYRRGWLPAGLIQAQRDFFGAHTYMRTDREGSFHTEWIAEMLSDGKVE
jgi:6-phosphogluconate dehydrogenase